MSDSPEEKSTTESPESFPNGLPFWITVASAVAVLLLVIIAVVLIVLSLSRRRKKLERRKSDVIRDRVERAFNASLKLKGNELLREDYERYVKSDVSPLKDRQESRKKSMTAAYDEVPYSPDDVKKPGISPSDISADIKRQRFAKSDINDVDSGNSSLASYGKEQLRHSLPNGTGYKHLRQSSSVDCSEFENAPESQGRENERPLRELGTGMNELDNMGRNGDNIVLSLHGEGEVDVGDDLTSRPGRSVGNTKFARSNSLFDHTDEVGITPL